MTLSILTKWEAMSNIKETFRQYSAMYDILDRLKGCILTAVISFSVVMMIFCF